MSGGARLRGWWRRRAARQRILVATAVALFFFLVGLLFFAYTSHRLLAPEQTLVAEEVEALVRQMTYLSFFLVFLGIGTALWWIRWVNRSLLRPLERLRESIDRLEAEGTLPPPPVTQLPELARLAERFLQLLVQARTRAMRDELTGLYNRRFAEEYLHKLQALGRRTGRPFSVLLLDLDNLKAFNDQLGHAAGDRLLRLFARILQSNLRRSAIPARWGGDEFIVLLPEEDLEGARLLADRLRARTAEVRLQAAQRNGSLTVSVGIAAYPRHGADLPQLLQAADRALYQAKREGRNRVRVPVGLPTAV